MENPQTKNELYKALLKAQGEFETLKKTETADTGKFKYKYVDLEAVLNMVLPILHANGLLMTQTTDIMGDMPVVVTTIYHAGTGDCIYGSYPLVSMDKNDPQKLGGSLTYARRYALLALLGIATEDDDAASATKPSGYVKPTASTSTAPRREFDELPESHPEPSCPICGGEMWDNRPKKASGEFKPTAPDFKCKDKECDGKIWPPKPNDPVHDIDSQTTSQAVSEMDSFLASEGR